jgi:hypothetical protein
MRLDKAVKFVLDNVCKIPSAIKFCVNGWSCIDSRVLEVERFAAPGDVLGFLLAVLAGLQLYERAHGPIGVAFDCVTNTIEEELGGMSFHTDTHAIKDGKTSVIAGCGHCNNVLAMTDEYGVDSFARELEEYIEKLKVRVLPKVLEGDRKKEQAVFVISQAVNGSTLTLPGTGKDGQRAFICHLEDWLDEVVSLASKVAHIVGMNETKFCECVRVAARHHLKVTLSCLAGGLPVYLVSCDESGEISVKLIADDAAMAIV